MDYAGFALDPKTLRPQDVVLLIEVKGPWQLDVEEWEILLELTKGGEQTSARVRSAIAQLFMYLVLSETQYGVLCFKSRYCFFCRCGDPLEKHLEVSRIISNGRTSRSVRQCWVYVSHLALEAKVSPFFWVEILLWSLSG